MTIVSLSDLFSRRRKEEPDVSRPGSVDRDVEPAGGFPVYATPVLARFVSGLSSREQPLLLDLGPVVGPNLTFFGEQLGCKILVEDLFKDIDRHVREGKLDQLTTFLSTRFSQADESVDGILCWDAFDYIDRPSARALAAQLTRILKADGVLLAFFNNTAEPPATVAPTYTKHVVLDRGKLQHRSYPAARGKQRAIPNRDIQRLFEPLRITEQFLLKTNLREVLFRKPAQAASTHAAHSA